MYYSTKAITEHACKKAGSGRDETVSYQVFVGNNLRYAVKQKGLVEPIGRARQKSTLTKSVDVGAGAA